MTRKRKPTSQWTQAKNGRIINFSFSGLMFNFKISNKQTTFHSAEVEKITDKAMVLLRNKNGQEAEKLFCQALALEPGKPDLLNNFASALILQNRSKEGAAVLETIHLLFPDYLFARTGLASIALRAGDLVRAAKLIEPLFERTELHFSEFDGLCMTKIDLLVMQSDLPAAKDWFKMWEECNPENPKLQPYRTLFQ